MILRKKSNIQKQNFSGKTFTEDSITDASQAIDVDIYACIEKYGIDSLRRKYEADTQMFLDVSKTFNLTVDEAVEQQNQMLEYFETMPARARKVFGDNPDIFVQKYRNGDFNDFIKTGALNEEQIKILNDDINQTRIKKEEDIIDKAKNKIIADYINQEAIKNDNKEISVDTNT